jgi:NAD(P)-dependent dehydrogenase (short-subunit alcohol dehydrogenase family)/acyl carrier protein
MRGGKHIGKQVIKFGDLIPSNIKPTLFDSNKTYVLSGGLGAVGFEVAKWMSWNGASHIVLLSRSARLSKYQEREFSSFKERHINVHISKTDVTKDVDSLFKELEDMKFPPVKGIIHLAMVLDDDAIELITPERFYKVYNPKVIGAQNLVSRFKPKDLDFIIFFSSFSSVSGNPNQVNYVAANSFLDRYAQLLTNQGYKAHVINMGAVGDVGVLATDFLVRMTLQAKGWYSPIYVSEICTAIHKILLSDVVQHIPLPNVLFTDSIPIYSHFSHLIKYQPKKTTETSVSEVTEENISKAISQLLDVQSIDPKQPLVNYGADSLLSVDISVMLKQRFGIAVSQMEILGGLTIQQIKKKAQLA